MTLTTRKALRTGDRTPIVLHQPIVKRRQDEDGIGVLLVVLTLYLFALEIGHLGRLEAAHDPQVGLIGLHVYGRGLFLAGVAFSAYTWHIRWIGDH